MSSGFVKEGQCSGRKGPGKGQSLAAARALHPPLQYTCCELYIFSIDGKFVNFILDFNLISL